jgi:arylsulfatase A-like enzyme
LDIAASLVEELRATGELESIYVSFTSDNGYHLGEHRLDKSKRTANEETIKVPLGVRGPGTSAGRSAK